MRLLLALLVAIVAGLPAAAAGEWWKDDNSWKKPLSEKARIFEENLLRNHWIEGLYVGLVHLPADGGPPDNTLTGNSNTAHSVSWTSDYLGGQAYRFAFTKDPAVREHCWQILRALRRLQEITPKPGLLCRAVVPGHGPSWEERAGENAEYWHQGTGQFSNYRWRGHPSHHNYDSMIHGYGAYYDIAADDAQKEFIRRDVHRLMSYILDNGLVIVDELGQREPFLGYTDGHTPNLRTIMVTSCLKTAYHVTGDQKFNRKYLELVEQYGYRTAATFRVPPRYTDFDDAYHVFGDLDNMFRQEQDPQLLAFYRLVLGSLWQAHQDDAQAWYSYMYHALSGKDGNDAAALRQLQLWPTVKVGRPHMNSIRDDIEKIPAPHGGELIAKNPLPMNERSFDFEWEWKSSPYELDSNLSQAVTSLAVAPEDPQVMMLVLGGRVHRSLDGGRRWATVGSSWGEVGVRDVALYGPRLRFALAATDQGVYRSTDGGLTWSRVAGGEGQGASQIVAAREAQAPFWAVMDDGSIWSSLTIDTSDPGAFFEKVGALPPPLRGAAVAVVPGGEPVIYAAGAGRFWRLQPGVAAPAGQGFQAVGAFPSPRVQAKVIRVAGKTVYAIAGAEVGYWRSGLEVVWRSRDGGRTWEAIVGDERRQRISTYAPRQQLGGLGLRGTVNDLTVDPRDPNHVLCATSKGIFASVDGGQTWTESNAGLRIKLAYRVFAPAETSVLYASTPGGLFESRDNGKTWQEGNLPGVLAETGSADFLTAYWPARYFGFIGEEQANAVPQ